MPKFYCDYCENYLTHDSPSVRKTHNSGRKHRDCVKAYYLNWMEDQAQHLIEATTAAFNAGKISTNPFSTPSIPPQLQTAQSMPRSMFPVPPPRFSLPPIPVPPPFSGLNSTNFQPSMVPLPSPLFCRFLPPPFVSNNAGQQQIQKN